MAVLEVSNLHKAYGDVRAVDGISFTIKSGEIFGLLGPNGAGKSTTINIVATLTKPDRGEVTIGGVRLSATPSYKRKLGYIPQEVSLAEKLTARENLLLVGRLYDLRGGELRRRAGRILDAVGLADRSDDLVSTFSGGMKRRLNIAAGLIHSPDLLLLDEPTAGVDPQARAYIFDIVERLVGQGCAVLYTTHYMEEAQRLCKRTAIIDQGRFLAAGTLDELIQCVKAKRDLVIEGDNLCEDHIAKLAARLSGLSWTLDGGEAHLNVSESGHSLLDAVRAADEVGLKPTAISIREPTLETVFLELTGRALRE